MKNGLTGLVIFLLEILVAYGQDLTRSEADSLRLAQNKSMPDTNRLDILFRLAEFYVVKTGENKQGLDSAAEYLKEAELINARLQSEDITGFQTLIASMIAKQRNQEKQGKWMAEKAVNILGNSSNKYYLGKAYFNLADYYRYTDRKELVEKIRLVELAVLCFGQSKYIESHANSVKFLADLYEINEQRSKVLENLNLSLKLYKSIHYPKLSGVYVLFNRYYYLGGNYKLALDYCLMALKDAESARDSTLLYCQINNYMAITLVHLKERERATGYYKTALQIAEKYSDNTAIILVTNNMVRNYIELKKPQEALELMKGIPKNLLVATSDEGYLLTSLCYASIYFELKDVQETEFYCNQILGLIKVHMPRAQVVNDFYNLLIRFYLESGQYVLARIYHQKIDSLSRKIGDPARIKENYYLAFRIDSATGFYRTAIGNLLKFQHLHDSLYDETSNRQMQQLEVEYETQKNKNEIKIKDQDIALLHQKNQLQQNNLDGAALVRNFIIAGIGLLLVILALLYHQFRLRQKSNDAISDKNELLQRLVVEKEWLLKEIHHRVKNNFQTVIGLLGTQSGYLKNEEAINAITKSRHRIHAMSLIHQRLYQTENLSAINISDYIHELVDYLRSSFDRDNQIRFDLQVEKIELDLAHCIPIGLILNEAITNSFKYAVVTDKEGIITISFKQVSENHLLLTISDNGTGLPAGFNKNKVNSMGINLMRGLSNEIGASFTMTSNKGTQIAVSFVYEPHLAVMHPSLST